MARFLKHIGCDRCGSSDAKAVYSDNSTYCFSCRKPTGSKVSPYVASSLRPDAEEETKVALPSDVTQNYPEHAVAWCNKYDITVQQMLQNNMVYSKWKDQLIFTWLSPDGSLLAYQARNLNAVSKAKRYYTCGDVNNLLPIYPCRSGTINEPQASLIKARRLVLVEDCLSAIKVANTNLSQNDEKALGCASMPLLGNSISREKLVRLRHLYGTLYVFLDGDMYPNAMKIAGQAQLLGFSTKVIYSEKDPKEHDKKSLTSLLI